MDVIRGITIALGYGFPICITVAFFIHSISVTLNKGRC
jgi:hypothetical protein